MLPTTVLMVAFASAGLVYLAGWAHARLRDTLAVLSTVVLIALVGYGYGAWGELVYVPDFLGLELVLGLNPLAWFFAIMVTVVVSLSTIFSLTYLRHKPSATFHHSATLAVEAAMLGIVFAGDLVSFFIFWEIMSWSAYLLISCNRGRALDAGLKYIIMSLVGSCAMLIGLLAVYSRLGVLSIPLVAEGMQAASSGFVLLVLLTFGLSFGIKSAMVPLHTWLPDAHSEAASPFSAVLSGVLIKMGIYGFVLLMYGMVGIKLLLGLGSGGLTFRHVLCWLGAITVVIPTFIALLQTDAKRLLAWSSIGQIGYIILGISFGTSLAFAGAIFHALNHALCKSLLFLAVGAVEHNTGGVRDLNKLGGLAKRMPVTFACALVAGLGLVGVPLTSGFVPKWLIYRALIEDGYPFLALAALLGTWGAILYVYKLLHNIFLGQLSEEHREVPRSPAAMRTPIMVFGLAILVFGVAPGIPLRAVQSIGGMFGLAQLRVTLWGLASEAGALNMLNIWFAVLIAFVAVFLVMRLGAKGPKVSQEDSYAAGSPVPAGRYHYSVAFYDPLSRMISPYLKDRVDQCYYWLAEKGRLIADRTRRMYTGYAGTYVLYIVSFLALLIFLQLVWQIW
jgi:formate hydrogenlyase subunit 3/multisubunit Na+/H+ antiporter MnhD subunit